MLNRRDTLTGALAAGIGAIGVGKIASALAADEIVTLPFANGERPLATYPGKRPLIRLTTRPPQLETPFSVFDEGIITPNDAFFVRYHLADIPLKIDPDAFRVTIQGKVGNSSVAIGRGLEIRFRAGRDHRGQSMRRQQPRFFAALRRRWPARRTARHGQRAVEGRLS